MFRHLEDDLNFQRLVAVAKGEETDRIPYDLCFASDFTANFYGIREREYYMFPEKMVAAQQAVIKRFCTKHHIATVFSLLRPDPCVESPAGSRECSFPVLRPARSHGQRRTRAQR